MLPETTKPASWAIGVISSKSCSVSSIDRLPLARLWRLRHREHEAHRGDAVLEGERALQAANVRGHGAVGDAGDDVDPAHHLLGVGELRDCLGMSEGGDLDLRHAGARDALITAILVSVGIQVFSAWKPSRGPTSMMWTFSRAASLSPVPFVYRDAGSAVRGTSSASSATTPRPSARTASGLMSRLSTLSPAHTASREMFTSVSTSAAMSAFGRPR